MKTVLAALAATFALAATLYAGSDPDGGTGLEEAGARNGGYVLVSGDVECRLGEGAAGRKLAMLDLDPDCAAAPLPVAEARMIERNGDGSIDLLGHDGKPVMRFAAAEGGTHVSYEPESPLIRLVALD